MNKINHFYNQIPGWPNELPQIYAKMVQRFPEGSHFVEVGAWKGASTVAMGVEIANSGKKIRFDVVDTWEGSEEHQNDQIVKENKLFEEFLNNITPVRTYINPIKMSSVEAANLYQDNSLDFVCIDANHVYEEVKKDIQAWLPKIKSGGMFAGDDFHHTWPGVIQAVKELLPNFQNSATAWWWTKP